MNNSNPNDTKNKLRKTVQLISDETRHSRNKTLNMLDALTTEEQKVVLEILMRTDDWECENLTGVDSNGRNFRKEIYSFEIKSVINI